MKQNRQSKIVSILALCVSILGLTLGFAAFSNTLTISSSAIVSPNSSDFKIRAYGIEFPTDTSDDVVLNIDSYTSEKISVPTLISYSSSENFILEGTNAGISINDNDFTISNMSATFSEPGHRVDYYFAIKNEGEYDAYLDLKFYQKLENGEAFIPITCTAKEGTSQSLVDKACENISYSFAFYNSSGEYIYFDVQDIIEGIDYHLLPADDYMFLAVTISYGEGEMEVAGRADGDFDITFGDVSFDFSTVAPQK